MFSLRDDASPYRWMGSALINGRKPVMRIAASPDDKKNKFDAIALTDIYGERVGGDEDGHAEIQPRGLVYETIDPEQLERSA